MNKIKKEKDSIAALIGLLKENNKLQNPSRDEQLVLDIFRADESTDQLIEKLRR
jgi:hypothetical protein